jgi:hypothetical protein
MPGSASGTRFFDFHDIQPAWSIATTVNSVANFIGI